MVSLDATASVSTTVQMAKDGVLQPQAQSTGTSLHFTTLVQVPRDNSNNCCASPTLIQMLNTGAEATFDNVNVVVTKVC